MFLTNKTRLKIKDIVKRISVDDPVSLEERIYVEKFAKTNLLGQSNYFERIFKKNTNSVREPYIDLDCT